MNLLISCDSMLLEAFEFLSREIITDKAFERVASQAERFKPGLGKVVYRALGSAQAGVIVGTIAGKQTQKNIAEGKPSSVYLERTPGIARYEDSAISSTRII